MAAASKRTTEKLEIVKGSGNVFADFGQPDAALLQLKAVLAAQIIKALNEMGLTVRKAENLTGTAAADFSRIRQADLKRFTVDRLMTILQRLGREVRVSVEERKM
ncbi:MAG: XRE family transcriptional regulator [Rhizomicrobium sp.]|nr:XRE family transcriptional regulator [Rhizomicrobium sp.]